ncbi:MAG: GNAT family N-acetyltransferase [Bauldia sp.]
MAARAEGRTARAYVVVAADGALAGCYCLATGSVARAAVPRKLRKDTPDPVPVAIIGRLAVAGDFARRGIGSGLLQDGFRRILQIGETIRCAAVVAHAIDGEAAGFYRKYGFEEFPDGTRTMFLPLATLRATIA